MTGNFEISDDRSRHLSITQLGVHHSGEDSCSKVQPDASRSELVEQVMRMTEDDLILLPFLTAQPGSAQLLSSFGRLLGNSPRPYPLGTPLAAWTSPGSNCSDSWRDSCGYLERSLWADLVFLRSLVANHPLVKRTALWCCPYEELETLRTLVAE